MSKTVLLIIAGITVGMIIWGFHTPVVSEEIMIVRYSEGYGAMTIVKADGAIETRALEAGAGSDVRNRRLAQLQQVLAGYQREGWRLSTSVNSPEGTISWCQDHFLVR
jgi:hypothetical protein